MTNVERLPAGRIETPEQQRDRMLDDTVTQMAARKFDEVRRNPKLARDEQTRHSYVTMIGELKTLQRSSGALAANAEKHVAPYFDSIDATGEASDRLEEICERIQAEIPEYGEEPVDHPYLTRSTVDPMVRGAEPIDEDKKLSIYHIFNGSPFSKGALRSDIAYLRGHLKNMPANSDASNTLMALVLHMEQMRMTDPPNTWEHLMKVEKGGRTAMDTGVREMGRVALAGIFLAGLTVTGIASIVQFFRKGELSLSWVFWLVAALVAADKDILKTMFGSDAKILQDFDDVNRVSTNPRLRGISRKYGVGGQRWSNVVEKLYDDEEEYKAVAALESPDADTIATTVNALSGESAIKPGEVPPKGTIRAALYEMLTTKDARGVSEFKEFFNGLMGATAEGGREFMVTFVRNDSFKAGLDMDEASKRDVKKAVDAKKAATGR